MGNGQGAIALIFGIYDQANGGNVINFAELFALTLHFFVNAVEVLGPTAHVFAVNAEFANAFLQNIANFLQPIFAIGPLVDDQLRKLLVGFGLQVFEAKIF